MAKGTDTEAMQAAAQHKPSLAYRIIKRTFDILFSLVVIVLLFIPVVIVALAISLESPGGAFFRQPRIGKKGKEIYIWKLRSMYADAHDNPTKYLTAEQMTQWEREQKVTNDPRITKIGKFTRKISLDELPQFINVLMGDMSVIGPRPVTLDETYEFGAYRDEVLSVKPGITGWWQVTARNKATWESGERQELELFYVRNQSLIMDLKVFFGTFSVMFGKKRTGK